VKIHNPDETGQGEICVSGRLIMMGYLKNEEATREVFDSEGFLHTGDLGR
jgi:long-chain-fatty-acid--CoA ligase ACSBG